MSHTLPIAQCTTEKITGKLLGEGGIEIINQRLDRLTQEEAWMTVASVKEVPEGA